MEFFPISTIASVLGVRYRASLMPQQLRVTAEVQVPSSVAIAESVLPVTMWHVACGLAADAGIPPWLGAASKLSGPDPRAPTRSARVEWEFEVTAMSPRFLLVVAEVATWLAAPGTPVRSVWIEGTTSDQTFELVTEQDLVRWAASERALVELHPTVPFAFERRYEDDRLALRVRFQNDPSEEQRVAFSSHIDSFLAIMDRVSNGRDDVGMHEQVNYAWALDEVTMRIDGFDHDADIAFDALLNTLSSYHGRVVPISHALILG
jgi:hypothetical protein